ncbi:MAG: terminase small subunit [Saprospiraceae bacterium]
MGGRNFLLGILFSKERVYDKTMPKKANQLKTVSELTPRQRKFVDIYVSNYGEISKVEAAKQAGFTSTNKYGPTDQASRLLNPDKNPHVVRYFEKRMAQELEKEEKDKLMSYKHYARMRDASEKKGQMTAAITAQYRRDQMAGHFIDRKEINHIGLEGMNREQLEKRLEELESKIGEAKNIIDITPTSIIENE